jgi:hypothetical protein
MGEDDIDVIRAGISIAGRDAGPNRIQLQSVPYSACPMPFASVTVKSLSFNRPRRKSRGAG